MKNSPACLATFLALTTPGLVFGLEHGNLNVVQLNTTNNGQTVVDPSIAVTVKPGATPNFSSAGGNRGDIDVAFSATPAQDPQNGVLITSVTQNGRDNSSGGGPVGITYAASHADVGSTGLYYIPTDALPGGAESGTNLQGGGEYNVNVAAAWFPFSEGWLGGHGRNATNGAALTLYFGSPTVRLGTEFVDLGGGLSTVNLTTLQSHGVAATASNGVLLVIGAKNEDNFAMSQDNPDGSFSLSVMDTAPGSATSYEQDGVAFAYVPVAAAGRGFVKAVARIQSDGTAEISGGNYTITKQGTGQWLLTIPGETDATGTLIVSSEGGKPPAGTTPNNTNNIVGYEWNAGLGGWMIQSRNEALTASTLEDGATPDEDMFSFVFLTTEPALALTTPAHGSLVKSGVPIPLAAAATGDTPAAIQQVEFFVNGQSVGTDSTSPYQINYTAPLPGYYDVEARATLVGGGIAGTTQAKILAEAVVPKPTLPGYSVAIIDGGDLEADTTVPATSPAWATVAGTPSPRSFSNLGTTPGEPAVKINGASVPFASGILFGTNYSGTNFADATTRGSIDNNIIPRNEGGNYAVAVEDNAQGGGDPVTRKESGRLSLGFFPFANGWTGANIGADLAVVDSSSSLPLGITVTNPAVGAYNITGLPKTGNLLAISTGAGADNTASVGESGISWVVNNRDNSQNMENAPYAFLYIPQESTQVLSGKVANDGTLTPLNAGLSTLGATVTLVGATYEIQFGDGTVINPTTVALFLTGDFNLGNGGDNIYSYSANGNKFLVFSQDLPGLGGGAQAGGFRFLAAPLAPTALNGDEVDIAVTDDTATEGTTDKTIEFKLTRTANIASPLTVHYTISGSAINGTDYQTLPLTATFAAGATTTTVTVTINDDTQYEIDETVGLTLVAGSGYSLGSSITATGTIHNAASIVPVVTVSFQDGSAGYDGTFTKFIGKAIPRTIVNGVDVYGDPVYTDILGANVATSGVDGFPGHKDATNPASDSPDVNALVRFDNLFGSGPGQIPVGATIAKAELKLTTHNGANSQSSGPFVVDRLVVPVNASTTYADLDGGTAGFEGARGGSSCLPLAAFGAMAINKVESGDVTAIVRGWAEALAGNPAENPNLGFSIYTGGTSDAWTFCTEGNANTTLRPRLVISYVQSATKTYTFSADQAARLIGQSATENGSLLESGFLDLTTDGTTQEGLMRFPVNFGDVEGSIPLDEEIVRAELVLVTGTPLVGGSASAQSPGPVAAHRMLVDWQPDTQFGYFGPRIGQEITSAVSRVSGMGQGSTAYLDLTSAAQAWRAGEPNYGVNLKPETTDGWQFFWPGSTFEGTTPQLRIVTAKLGSGGTNGFQQWATGQGVTGAAMDSDSDKDGVTALVEYALGLDPKVFSKLPALTRTGGTASIQFTKGVLAAADTGVSYKIQSSANLVDWADETPTVNDSNSISLSTPAAAGKKFFRLRVDYAP